jgi:hypothetical protein
VTAAATFADRVAAGILAQRFPGDDPTPSGGGARAPKPVLLVDEDFGRACLGRHAGPAPAGTRVCRCGRRWCGTHADASRDGRCRGCGGATVLVADVTVEVRAGREMGWAA